MPDEASRRSDPVFQPILTRQYFFLPAQTSSPSVTCDLLVVRRDRGFFLTKFCTAALDQASGFAVAGAKIESGQKFDGRHRAVGEQRAVEDNVRNIGRQGFAADFGLPACGGGDRRHHLCGTARSRVSRA